MARPLGLCLGLVLSSTRAAGASSFGPAASSEIRAGSVETALLEIAAAGVGERELILSLDGGRTFPVRLTREIEPDEGSVSWRVPALPSEHAVLALREGGDGSEEEIVAVSAEFTIFQGPGLPAEELRFQNGEWKTREADPGGAGLPTSSLGEAVPERWKPLEEAADTFEEPVRALAGSPDSPGVPAGCPAPALAPDRSLPRSGISRFVPLRE